MACIWYISKYVAVPTQGGPAGRGYLIMRELARLDHDCVVITSDSHQLASVPILTQAYLREDLDGIELWWVKTLKYEVAKSLRRILSWLHFEWRLWLMPKKNLPAPDVIVISSLSLLTVVNGFWLRRQYSCRLVLEIRDIWPLTITEEGGFGKWNPLVLFLAWIEKIGYKHADVIVGTMPNLAEHVVGVIGEPRPTYCIPMGVNVNDLMPCTDLPLNYAEQFIPKGKFIVMYAGTIGITNALDTLFNCAIAMKKNFQVHFIVVGDGDLKNYYRDKYGHLPNLTFAPKVKKSEVSAVLMKSDLLYFSSHDSSVWRFGQSLNKVIDYMLAGKPVVASYTGYPSMINEAGSGTFVPAGDVDALESEIERYLSIPRHDRDAMGAKGRSWILANRSYQKLAEDYLKILIDSVPKAPKI